MDAFICEPIEVILDGMVKRPISFQWKGMGYRVVEIWAEWQDAGFGPIPPGRGKWWQRRHRNYYRVVTHTGEVFEIYFDRGGKQPQWYLFRKVEQSD